MDPSCHRQPATFAYDKAPRQNHLLLHAEGGHRPSKKRKTDLGTRLRNMRAQLTVRQGPPLRDRVEKGWGGQ